MYQQLQVTTIAPTDTFGRLQDHLMRKSNLRQQEKVTDQSTTGHIAMTQWDKCRIYNFYWYVAENKEKEERCEQWLDNSIRGMLWRFIQKYRGWPKYGVSLETKYSSSVYLSGGVGWHTVFICMIGLACSVCCSFLFLWLCNPLP